MQPSKKTRVTLTRIFKLDSTLCGLRVQQPQFRFFIADETRISPSLGHGPEFTDLCKLQMGSTLHQRDEIAGCRPRCFQTANTFIGNGHLFNELSGLRVPPLEFASNFFVTMIFDRRLDLCLTIFRAGSDERLSVT